MFKPFFCAGLYCVVDIEDGPQIISSNWLNDDKTAAYWPAWATDKVDQVKFDKFVKKRPVPEQNWIFEKVLKIRSRGGKIHLYDPSFRACTVFILLL